MITEEQYAGMLMTTKSLQKQLIAMTMGRDGLQRAYDTALRQMNDAIAKTEWLRTDPVAKLERELAEIKDATRAAMDERCDCNERHCSCVPLLRAEVRRLTAERDKYKARLENEKGWSQ